MVVSNTVSRTRYAVRDYCACCCTCCMWVWTNLDLAHLGGHGRYFFPPLSPSRPVIADEKIIFWGTFLNFFAFFAPQALHSTAHPIQPAQADNWLEPACRRAFIQRAEFSKRTKKSKSAWPTKIYNYSHSASVMREPFCLSVR